MSEKRILIINGHPDILGNHFNAALADAYCEGAESASHTVKRINIAELDFPLLRSQQAFECGDVPALIAESQQMIRWANHLLVIFPLWHGTTPAYFKAYIEQVFRYGFGMSATSDEAKGMPKKLLTGKTARIVVTMGMPGLIYRFYFGGHGVKYLKTSVLKLSGISPVRISLIGMVDAKSNKNRIRWLNKMRKFGARSV